MEENKEIEHNSRMEKISYAEKGRFFKLRNILNIAFIILALAGMGIYLFKSQSIGGPIIIVAIAIKMLECILRYMR